MISSNHGLTAHVGYWNSPPLLQLCTRVQDRNGAPRTILVTLELAELDALEWNIGRAEALLNEHNTRMHAGPARLLFRQLSTLDSGRLHQLEVSRWQGYVRASVRRFFINSQGDLYPTKDGIQYNVDQLAILRWLFPLICRDFAMAARNADQTGARKQETMDLILAHERELQAEKKLASVAPGFKAGMRSIAMRLGPPPPGRTCWDHIISGTPAFHLRWWWLGHHLHHAYDPRGRNTRAQVKTQEGRETRTQESQGSPPRQWTWMHGCWPYHHSPPTA